MAPDEAATMQLTMGRSQTAVIEDKGRSLPFAILESVSDEGKGVIGYTHSKNGRDRAVITETTASKIHSPQAK